MKHTLFTLIVGIWLADAASSVAQTLVNSLDDPISLGAPVAPAQASTPNGGESLGQAFTPSTATTVGNVTLRLENVGAATGTTDISLWLGDGQDILSGAPVPGTQLADFGSLSASDITSSWANYTLTLSTPVNLDAGITYYIVASSNDNAYSVFQGAVTQGILWASSTSTTTAIGSSGTIGNAAAFTSAVFDGNGTAIGPWAWFDSQTSAIPAMQTAHLVMDVEEVPEPPLWGCLVLGIGSLLGLQRFRRAS